MGKGGGVGKQDTSWRAVSESEGGVLILPQVT